MGHIRPIGAKGLRLLVSLKELSILLLAYVKLDRKFNCPSLNS